MLTFFPTLYPDETLYSGWARYAEYTGFSLKWSLKSDLFSHHKDGYSFKFFFEANIESFVKNLPQLPQYTSENLVNNHTLLPLYAITLTSDEFKQAKAMMLGARKKGWVRVIGQRYSSLNYARFCEKCVKEDQIKYGETYWHRMHQIPGIEICPHHFEFLKNSSLSVHGNYIPTPATARNSITSCLKTTKIEHSNYLELQKAFSKNAQYLLEHPDLGISKENTSKRILIQLYKHDLASPTGFLHNGKILQRLTAKYPLETLSNLGFFCPNQKCLRLPKMLKGKASFLPVACLLLFDFLGIDFPSFINQSESIQPFGTGPWNCFNPVCEYYMKPVITEQKLYQYDKKARGLFSCKCGFSYTLSRERSVPSSDDAKICVHSYGKVWLKELKKLLHDPTLTFKQRANHLGISVGTLDKMKKQIRDSSLTDKYTISLKKKKEKRKLLRSKWIMLCDNKFSRSQLKELYTNIYMWLYVNDKEWFEQNTPKRKKVSEQSAKIDWEKIDTELSNAMIPNAIKEIYSREGKPVRITKKAVRVQLGLSSRYLRENNKNLPNTTAILARIREKNKSFILRSIEYKGNCFLKLRKIPSKYNFNYEYQKYGHIPEVMKKIYDTIEKVSRELGDEE